MQTSEWVGRERRKGGGGHIKTIISWQSLWSELDMLIIEFHSMHFPFVREYP